MKLYAGCDYKFQNDSGSFGVDNYPTYQYCSWSVTVKQGLEVFIEFTALAIDDCSENKLEIYDGVGDKGSLLAVYCGKNATAGNTLRSTGNSVHVIFKSGAYSGHRLAFKAQYKAERSIAGKKNNFQ